MLKLFRRKGHEQSVETEDKNLALAALLTCYLRPRALPSPHIQEDWRISLSVEYTIAIQRLIEAGDLRGLDLRESLQSAKAGEIETALKEQGLRVSGRKAELVDRLIENAPDVAQCLAEQHAKNTYVVTESGREKALAFENEQNRRKEQARQQARGFIRTGDLEAACTVINQFYTWLPSSMQPGINMNWDAPDGGMHLYRNRATYILEHAHSSWVAQEIPEHLRQDFILAAAESELWPGPIDTAELKLSEEDTGQLKRSARGYLLLLTGWAINALTLQNAKELSIAKVIIHTCNDTHVCPHCQRLAADTYSLNRAPMLPSPQCTNEVCRCSYGLSVI